MTDLPFLVQRAMDGNMDALRHHIRNGGSPDEATANGMSALHAAASKGHDEAFIYLLKNGADHTVRDHEGATPLMAVVTGEHVSSDIPQCLNMLQALVEEKADVNAATNVGLTPLMVAAENGYGEIVKFLLEAGADPDAKALGGETAMSMAAAEGYGECCDMIREAQKRRSAEDRTRRAAEMAATMSEVFSRGTEAPLEVTKKPVPFKPK